MRHWRLWVFFALLALGILAIGYLSQAQISLGAIFSGYGIIAFILVMVLLAVIFRTLQGHDGRRDSQRHPRRY
ncbi:MAG: hypothetical protein K8I30_17010 [Anaerolineae bacterium]|nr:hypothetical protein [Anaerolineae bacterium]